MRITELFTAKSIALDVAAKNQAEIIDRLVELQATHGNITDTEAYKKPSMPVKPKLRPMLITASRCRTQRLLV